ncbi:MAG: hypothetical protein GY865_18915 [candidate division Zixibacteria bacterium]|nr:hypothetical protein [candidate division Zixibacteria bacterium]
MIKILLLVFCCVLMASSAFSWAETLYDTVEVKWSNGNLKEYYTRYWFTGNENGFWPDGQYSSFYENGQLQEQGNYIRNIKNGVWIKWDAKGNRIEELNYFNGKKTGTYIKRHPECTINIYGYYKDDYKNGYWIFQQHTYDDYNPQLKIDSVLYYQNDTLLVVLEGYQGEWLHENPEFYNSDYDIWIEWKRHNGMDYLSNYLWFEIGKKTGSKKSGQWIKHSPNGEIIEINYYKNGELITIE